MSDNANQALDLALLQDFAAAVDCLRHSQANSGASFTGRTEANGLYCAQCGGRRRMVINRLLWQASKSDGAFQAFRGQRDTPAFFFLVCVQCKSDAVATVYSGPDGPELAILSSQRGGLSTPNTPASVAYYLDQAHRAESVSASSAAAAMYRSALEMLLFQEGYTEGMLAGKIKDLLADVNPPLWRERIDEDYLEILKQIGNGAMHPNDGDVAKQSGLDGSLLNELRVVFEELLDVIYEQPARTAARKEKLSAVASTFQT